MIAFVSIIHALACLFIVIFILLQDPKGGVLGTLGGGGGSRSFFGSEGASPFLVTVTKWLAILFACSSFYLSYMSSQRGSVMDDLSDKAPISSSQNPSQQKTKPSHSSDKKNNSDPQSDPKASQNKNSQEKAQKTSTEESSPQNKPKASANKNSSQDNNNQKTSTEESSPQNTQNSQENNPNPSKPASSSQDQ